MAKTLLMNFLKGILAGLAIGLGGFLFTLLTFLLPNEYGKILGSLVFAVGLFLVCTFYLSLYTGKIGLVFERKQEKSFYISLPIMLIGNFIGACFLGYLAYVIFKNTEFINRAIEVARVRNSYTDFTSYLLTFITAFFCGLFVYLAVKSFAADRLRFKGTFLLVFFVFTFVYFGLEHCIANMFYFSFANDWSLGSWLNVLIVIVGNSLGTLPGVLLLKIVQKNKK